MSAHEVVPTRLLEPQEARMGKKDASEILNDIPTDAAALNDEAEIFTKDPSRTGQPIGTEAGYGNVGSGLTSNVEKTTRD
jgi:hypothetical protein